MSDTVVVGVVGGGQLARMMIQNAPAGVSVVPMDPNGVESPAGMVSIQSVVGSTRNCTDIAKLSKDCDVVTWDVEHVDLSNLDISQSKFYPGVECLRTIQNKWEQKNWMKKHNVPLGDFFAVTNETDRQFPVIVKARTGGYDGKGNIIANDEGEFNKAVETLGGLDKCYFETLLDFEREVACIVVGQQNGPTLCYPLVDLYSEHSACHLTVCPSNIAEDLERKAKEVAIQAVSSLPDAVGVFGVELFVMPDGRILFNELAPRPHNTGHYTIEACVLSQFEVHLRAVAGLPIPENSVELKEDVNSAVMLNLFGHYNQARITDLSMDYVYKGLSLTLYGKKEWRPHRKMGHCTAVGSNGPSDLLDALETWSGISLTPYHPTQVGIIMGSMSDMPCMTTARTILQKFNIPFEVRVVSAHRTPDLMYQYAKEARGRGLRIIIAGAGGAAHLPGMVASLTTLPVIGVPVKSRALNGIDSLYSIVQMPRGVPVATVAIDNSTNAALLAVRMLAMNSERLTKLLEEYKH